jgi:hypothetical protein
VIFGAILIALMFLAPEGLNGGFFRLLGRYFRVVPPTPVPRRPDRMGSPSPSQPGPREGGEPIEPISNESAG